MHWGFQNQNESVVWINFEFFVPNCGLEIPKQMESLGQLSKLFCHNGQ